MNFNLIRTLRTPSSERYFFHADTRSDAAMLDLHYLADGSVVGTLVLIDDQLLVEGNTQSLLQFIDESLLPMASLDQKNLSFTVVQGKLVGQFENDK